MNGFDFSTISDLYVGGTQASAAYYGSNLIWEAHHDYSQDYFTIEAIENSCVIRFRSATTDISKTIEYSTDLTNWTSVTSSTDNYGALMATLNRGDKLYLKGTNSAYATSMNDHTRLYSSKNFNAYGNLASLVNGDNFKTSYGTIGTYAFEQFFSETKVVDASNLILPWTTLNSRCYHYMFNNAKELLYPPQNLPATTLKDYCYQYMFRNCTKMKSSPALPATTLKSYCYYEMFIGCTSLTSAPALSATTLATGCYRGMFSGCTSLTDAPVLPATTLLTQSYLQMFYGCTNLNNVKCLATDISASNCLDNWLSNVSSTGTFYKDVSMTSFPTGASGIPSGWTVQNASS